MDFRTALAEFVDLLSVASRALARMATREKAVRPDLQPRLLEIETMAKRLREIAEELGSSPKQ